MTDTPWQGDASSLVEAFRKGEHSPREELEATLAAIDSSKLNAFSHLDPERALAAADRADVSLPFGGVPAGVKELDAVTGWPDTDASLVFKDRIATSTSPNVERLRDAGGAVLVGLTTASEFGGLNVSITKLNGITHNPWQHGRTVGGSSAGSSSAVAGGLVTIATGSDGGGSIRIPAAYTGLFGMKGTFGRVPRGPAAFSRPNTAVQGCLSRSVRDSARFYDVAAGPHPLDPLSITSPGGWEAGLGTHDLAGLKVAVVPGLGGVKLEPGVEARIREHAAALIEATGMKVVDIPFDVPNITAEWMMGNVSTLMAELGDLWPDCAGDLTQSVEDGIRLSSAFYNLRTAGIAEHKRLLLNQAMADIFDQVDLVIGATNPGPAFAADAEMSSPLPPAADKVMSSKPARLGARAALGAVRAAGAAAPNLPASLLTKVTAKVPDMLEMGGLTICSNIYGNPAISIPAGLVKGLPVGMQVLARHHADALLFDVGLAAERELPLARHCSSGLESLTLLGGRRLSDVSSELIEQTVPLAPTPQASGCPVPHVVQALAPEGVCPFPHGMTDGERPAVQRSRADNFVRKVLRVKERPTNVSDNAALKAFEKSMLISATRCTLTYVVFPFVLPMVHIFRGVAPVIGIVIGLIAMCCDVFTIRRFFAIDHKWRWYFAAAATSVICLLAVLLVQDITDVVHHVAS